MLNWMKIEPDNALREKGFVRYSELSPAAQKEVMSRATWDFVNNCPRHISDEKVNEMLSSGWYSEDGGKYIMTL